MESYHVLIRKSLLISLYSIHFYGAYGGNKIVWARYWSRWYLWLLPYISWEKMPKQYLLRHCLNATVNRHDRYCLGNWNIMSLYFFMISTSTFSPRCSRCHHLQFHYMLGPTRDQRTRYVSWPYTYTFTVTLCDNTLRNGNNFDTPGYVLSWNNFILFCFVFS